MDLLDEAKQRVRKTIADRREERGETISEEARARPRPPGRGMGGGGWCGGRHARLRPRLASRCCSGSFACEAVPCLGS